jgi:hypothetical protein
MFSAETKRIQKTYRYCSSYNKKDSVRIQALFPQQKVRYDQDTNDVAAATVQIQQGYKAAAQEI